MKMYKKTLEKSVSIIDIDPEFVDWYNDSHLHSGIQFVSLAACHEGRHLAILEKRKQVYEGAKKRYPER